MRVKLRSNVDLKILRADTTYTVYAIYIIENKTEFMVMSEAHSFPVAVESSNVDIIDNKISSFWVYGTENSSSNKVILSFPEWANDSYFYQNLVESNGKAGVVFRAYQQDLDMEFASPDIILSASILQDNWVQCPKCDEAWQSNKCGEVVSCPKCNSLLLNPFI